MIVEVLSTYDALSYRAKELIVKEIKDKRNLLLCTATGGTPTTTYDLLAKEGQANPGLFNVLRIIKLDEWGGIPMDHPATCETYLQTHLLKPLNIKGSRYIGFNSDPEDPEEECKSIQEKLKKEGPVDLCILGLGMNGHLAFNEPADSLYPHCHKAALTGSSQQHEMVAELKDKPSYGLTLGMADIMQSRKIIMLINGAKKKEITRKFLSGKITPAVPGSFLWLHPDVTCLIDEEAAVP